jgi:hypothetical protein
MEMRRFVEAVQLLEMRLLTLEKWIDWGLVRGGQKHTFRFEKFVDGFYPVFPAEARHLHPAEWHHETIRTVRVDPDRPGFERLRHTHRPTDVSGPDASYQAVYDAVTQLDSVLFVVKAYDREGAHFMDRN